MLQDTLEKQCNSCKRNKEKRSLRASQENCGYRKKKYSLHLNTEKSPKDRSEQC